MPVRMIGQLMPPTLQGVGRADLSARNQVLVCAVMIAAFLVGVRWGIVGLSVAWLAAYPLAFVANLGFWLPVLGLRGAQLLEAMARPAIAGAGMFACVAAVRAAGFGEGGAGLATLIFAGAISYAGFSWAFNRAGVDDLAMLLRRGRGAAASAGGENAKS